MKIHLDITQKADFLKNTASEFHSISKSAPQPQDLFVTMAGSKSLVERIKNIVSGSWSKIRGFFATTWEWIYWIIRLCPTENTRMEVIDSIIEDPNSAVEEAKKNPSEFVGEIIAATLIDPKGVDAKRRENQNEVGKFIRKFKREIPNLEALLFGKNNIFKKIKKAIFIFEDSKPDQEFVKFLLDRPHLVSGAIKSYCKRAYSEIGEKKDDELDAIRLSLQYLEKVADQEKEDPTGFNNFLKELFAQSSFNFEDIGSTANKNLDNAKLSSEEASAFKKCSEKRHRALNRLNDNPNFLNLSSEANLGLGAMRGAFLSQLNSSDFKALAGLTKEDYPLGSEICEQLADIAQYPSQFKKVCHHFSKALEILQTLKNDYDAPPPEKE